MHTLVTLHRTLKMSLENSVTRACFISYVCVGVVVVITSNDVDN